MAIPIKGSSLPSDYIKYKKARAVARKTIKEAKRKGWQEFCTNIDSKTSTRDAWNKLKCISKTNSYKGIPTLLDKNKQCVVTDNEKADLLAESFAAVSSTWRNFRKLKIIRSLSLKLIMIIKRLLLMMIL